MRLYRLFTASLFLAAISCAQPKIPKELIQNDGLSSAKAPTAIEKPNVIIIFMDDLGYGDLSSYGHPTIKTPNIDRLASEGQKWTNFYTASSVCSPSRGALLTGRYPIRIGLGGIKERVFFPKSMGGLPASEITIAEMLKEEGYKTGIIGKWHLGHLPEYLPTRQGFDTYYGIPYSNDMDAVKGWNLTNLLGVPDINKWNVPLMENESIIERPADQTSITKRYTEKAVEFIENHQADPFFLYFPHTMVHTPLFAYEDFLGTSERGFFGDVMNEVDWSVGQVISTLERLEIDRKTLVVFTSDNGPWLMMRDHGGSPGLLREGKGTTWEGGMRVPGIFYMPGTVTPGTITDLGSTLDLLPTIAKLTGAQVPQDRIIDGYDLTPVLQEKRKGNRNHMIFYRKQDIYAVRKEDYKAHFITESSYKADNGRQELEAPLLYNVNHDPSERYDHAAQMPEKIEEIIQLAISHRNDAPNMYSEMDKYPEEKN